MGALVDSAERKLCDRMMRARERGTIRRRFFFYVLPIGFVAIALLISLEMGEQRGVLIQVSPLIAAGIFARTCIGITAGRMAATIIAPILLYIGYLNWHTGELGSLLSITGLCFEPSMFVRGSIAPIRQSVNSLSVAPTEPRKPI